MKIIQISFLLYFLTIIANGFSQNHQIDSLNKSYEKYQYKNLLKAEQLARKVVTLSKKTGNETLLLKSNDNLLTVLLKNRKVTEAKKIALENLELAGKIKNHKYLCSAYSYLGFIYRRLREYDKSLTNIEKGLSIAKEKSFKDLEHRLLNYKAVLFRRTKNNKKAKHILLSIMRDSVNKNIYTLTYSYNSLASLYNKFEKKRDSSAYFYKKGIKLIQNTDNLS
jgi:tetratricopeptide (TPR) repeat protein